MFKNGKMQYVIKTCSSDNTQELQNLLNEMSLGGWELYTINEIETDNGFVYNCIFMSEMKTPDNDYSNIVNVSSFKTQMEKMLSPQLSPYEKCVEVQSKIVSRQKEINKIKSQIEKELPTSIARKKLNDKMSAGLKELETLRRDLSENISPNLMFARLKGERLSICLGEELLKLVDEETDYADDALIPETVKIRLKLTDELGFVLPKIVFRDDETLEPYEFAIKIHETCVHKGLVYPGYTMFFADELHLEKKPKNSISGVDTVSGRKVIWLEKSQTEDFWEKGIKPSEYIARLVGFFALKNAEDVLDYSDVNRYIEVVSEYNSFLVENIIPEVLSISDLKFILVKLIKGRVSIKDIVYIFEKLNDYAEDSTKDDIVQKLRIVLSDKLCENLANEEGEIELIELSLKTLNSLAPNSDFDEDTEIFRVDAGFAIKLCSKIQKKCKEFNITCPNILVPLDARELIFDILDKGLSNFNVVCHEELSRNYTPEIIATI